MPPKRNTTACQNSSSLSASSPCLETTPLAPELKPAQPPPVQVTPLGASSTEQSAPPVSASLKIFKSPETITVSTMQHAQTQLLLTKILKNQKLVKQLVLSLQQQPQKGNGVCAYRTGCCGSLLYTSKKPQKLEELPEGSTLVIKDWH